MRSKTRAAAGIPPKYLQIYEDLRQRIESGGLNAGDRLPSFMQLREQYGAMPATVERAYARLENEKLVERRARQGVFVAQRRGARTGKIGLLIHSLGRANQTSPFTESLLAGVRTACAHYDLDLVLLEREEAGNARKTDGVLLYCDKLNAYALGLPPGRPHVLMARRADGIVTVTSDDFAGGRLAANHLLANGHTRIACLMEELLDEPTQRSAGYRAALQEAGIAPDPAWVRRARCVNLESSSYLHWGRENMTAWLESDWSELGCTAIVAQNDQSAIGIMQVLQERGISVPGEVSVIGFDGTCLCDVAMPRLTSIGVPLQQIGFESVKALRDQMEYGPQGARNLSLPVELRAGESVASLSGDGADSQTARTLARSRC